MGTRQSTALAIRFDEMIHTGAVKDQAELARLGRVSRARLTQITALLGLAPETQEELLLLPMIDAGREYLTERRLRSIAGTVDWKGQRQV